jgi:cell division septum initiation protein DivIVA
MLAALDDIQEFLDHTRQRLEGMQQRQADIQRHLEELEHAT